MKILSTLGLVCLATLFIGGLLIMRPVPIPGENDCLVVKGTVDHIYEGGVKDVVFVLNDHKTRYYINRGLEQGLDLEQLRESLLQQEITIKYPEYWTPLDHTNSIRHISKVEFGDNVIFSELN